MFEFEKITESVWAHTQGDTFGHVAFVKLKDRLVFIDTGYFPKVIEEARKSAEEITGLTVKNVIITHHHGDHILGNQAFEDCEIISSKSVLKILSAYWTEENIENLRKREPNSFSDLRIVLPNKTFEGEYILTDNNLTLKIVQTNGHTNGSSFVFIPQEEVLIAGDLLFAKEVPYFGDDTTNPYLWIEAYKEMINLSPKIIIPGHGPVSDIEEMQEQLDYMEKCVKWMEDFVNSGGKKEELEKTEDFPMLDYEPYDNFELLFTRSKNRTYDVVKEKLS
jgi:glyoxylase-like metal-dependent hydrolase (beta-lactamase superfamily II)